MNPLQLTSTDLFADVCLAVCETYLKLKIDNSVKAYAPVWPRRKVYQ